MRLATAVGDGVEAAQSKGRRTPEWYDALCLLEEMASLARFAGDADRTQVPAGPGGSVDL